MNTFKRYELKYMLDKNQYHELLEVMKNYMQIDKYKKHTISNIYFDTPDFRLIRRSIEKPEYKEKLRVRTYGKFTNESKVFVEMKKKYDGVVYKRRLTLDQEDAYNFLIKGKEIKNECQISKELDYFLKFYGNLAPAIALNYDREAFFGLFDNDFRMTFDHDIRISTKDISFEEHEEFQKILDDDKVLLEVKTAMGIPNWLLEFFSTHKIYKTSFSKYGKAYTKYILGEKTHVA